MLLFTRNYVVSVGEVCSSSGCLGLLAYTMVRAVVDATEIIRYVESVLTGHLNDAQTFGLNA